MKQSRVCYCHKGCAGAHLQTWENWEERHHHCWTNFLHRNSTKKF